MAKKHTMHPGAKPRNDTPESPKTEQALLRLIAPNSSELHQIAV
jgi:hypothetical protein